MQRWILQTHCHCYGALIQAQNAEYARSLAPV